MYILEEHIPDHEITIENYGVSIIQKIVCVLTNWGLVMPFGDRDLGHHWLR